MFVKRDIFHLIINLHFGSLKFVYKPKYFIGYIRPLFVLFTCNKYNQIKDWNKYNIYISFYTENVFLCIVQILK